MIDVADIGFDFFDRFKNWRQLRKDVNAKMRLFYLECRRNLALIDCMKLGEKDEKMPVAELLPIVRLLETEILEMIFMDGEKGNKLFKNLSKKIKHNYDDKNDSIDGDPDETKTESKRDKTIIQAAMFAYVRISLIKKLSSLPSESIAFSKINLILRLRNIKEALLSIVKKLHEENVIREMEGLKE